jgi:hypothetical protein
MGIIVSVIATITVGLFRILQALALAEPRGPSALQEPDAGAVLALACHCVMVDNGFLVRPSCVDINNNQVTISQPCYCWHISVNGCSCSVDHSAFLIVVACVLESAAFVWTYGFG